MVAYKQSTLMLCQQTVYYFSSKKKLCIISTLITFKPAWQLAMVS